MELKSKELTLLEDALNALIESHQRVIGEIKNSDETFYENKLFLNKFRVKPLTVEDLKQLDIEKELKRI